MPIDNDIWYNEWNFSFSGSDENLKNIANHHNFRRNDFHYIHYLCLTSFFKSYSQWFSTFLCFVAHELGKQVSRDKCWKYYCLVLHIFKVTFLKLRGKHKTLLSRNNGWETLPWKQQTLRAIDNQNVILVFAPFCRFLETITFECHFLLKDPKKIEKTERRDFIKQISKNDQKKIWKWEI